MGDRLDDFVGILEDSYRDDSLSHGTSKYLAAGLSTDVDHPIDVAIFVVADKEFAI